MGQTIVTEISINQQYENTNRIYIYIYIILKLYIFFIILFAIIFCDSEI